MTGFTADWLALRAAADEAARNGRLTEALIAACANKERLRIVDLGAGAGANLRFLAPRLAVPQHWVLVDRDRALLDRAVSQSDTPPGVSCAVLELDLAHDLEKLDLGSADIVTASALMDLVSAPFIDRFISLCRATGALLFFVLSFDGRIGFSPPDPTDRHLVELFNRHQMTDKGFGTALGPKAAAYLAQRLRESGYDVQEASSDWRLGPESAALQDALLAGYANAAREVAPTQASAIVEWLRRRRSFLSRGTACLTIGHRDLFAQPQPAAVT